MLFAKPTKYNVGLTLYGDYHDFCSLYSSIHEIADEENGFGAMSEFILTLAYEIRHTYQGDRETLTVEGGTIKEPKESIYIGCQIVWTNFLPQLVMLRDVASFVVTSRTIQADLMRLEACAEEALLKADVKTGKECLEWIKSGMRFSPHYNFNFIVDSTYQYIYGFNDKHRIKRLPYLLKHMSPFSPDYKEFNEDTEEFAKEKKIDVNSVRDGRDWEEFDW